jgi:hypothetical protein
MAADCLEIREGNRQAVVGNGYGRDAQNMPATFPAFFVASRIFFTAAECSAPPTSTPIETARS